MQTTFSDSMSNKCVRDGGRDCEWIGLVCVFKTTELIFLKQNPMNDVDLLQLYI